MLVKRMLISFTVCASTALNLAGCSVNFKTYKHTIDQISTRNMTGINEIVIDNSSTDINIIPEDRDNIEAHLYGKVSISSKGNIPKLTVTSTGDKLTIKNNKEETAVAGIYSSNLKLDIRIPKNYEKDIYIDSSSGNINIHDLKLDNYKCKLSSGDTEMKDLRVEDLFYEASSGDFKGENIETKAGQFKASSGGINISGFSGKLKVRTNSGEIKIDYKEFNNDVELQASSGDVELNLPLNAEFYLDAEVSSGDIECIFPITIKDTGDKNRLSGTVKSDKNKVRIKTNSGDIRVNSK